MSDSIATILPSGVGYGVVVGIGGFFTIVMIGISMLQVLPPLSLVPGAMLSLAEQVHELLNQDQRGVQYS